MNHQFNKEVITKLKAANISAAFMQINRQLFEPSEIVFVMFKCIFVLLWKNKYHPYRNN